MRRLPNGQVRPDSKEKAIFAQLKRIIKPGEWFTLRQLKKRLRTIEVIATLREIENCVRHLRRGDGGCIMEREQIGNFKGSGNPIYRYKITGRRSRG